MALFLVDLEVVQIQEDLALSYERAFQLWREFNPDITIVF